MLRRIGLSILFIFALMFIVSCSGGDGYVTSPSVEKEPVVQDTGKTACLGLWQVTVDKEAGTIEAVDMRSGNLILNVLGFIEPPLLSGLTIDFGTLVFDPANNKVEVDVILTHPIPDPVFTGFDVRGVVYGPKVRNADGLTPVLSPQLFKGVYFGYLDGLLGVPDSVAHYGLLGSFKYFGDGIWKTDDLATFFSDPANLANRGRFSPKPQQSARHYVLDWTDTGYGFMVFNYAVYANYNWPTGTPPFELEDFPITTANSQEAFCYKVTETGNYLYMTGSTGGGTLSMDVDIFDWQGNINNVSLKSEVPGLMDEVNYTTYLGPGSLPHCYKYRFTNVPGKPVSAGDLDLLITVTDSKTYGQSWFMSMLPASNELCYVKNYVVFRHTTKVIECPAPTVTSITPTSGWGATTVSPVTIKGTFVDGPSLAVRLKQSGKPDVVATDVKYVNSTTLTCTLNLLGAYPGLWTVAVTNGCPLTGQLANAFEVFGCGPIKAPSGYTYQAGSSSGNYPFFYYGCGITKKTPNRIMSRVQPNAAMLVMCPLPSSGTIPAGVTATVCTSPAQVYADAGFAITATNKVYYVENIGSGTNDLRYRLRSIQWDEATVTWGTPDTSIPPLPYTNEFMLRIGLDDKDNPIAFASNSSPTSLKRIYRWDGVSWTFVDFTSAVPSSSYSLVMDFAYNPYNNTYVVLIQSGPSGDYKIDLYAVTSTGALYFKDLDIFAGVNYPCNYRAGIYIDQSKPFCRVLVYGSHSSATTWTTPVVRYNANYGERAVGSISTGSQYPSYNCYNADYSPDLNRLYIPQQTVSLIWLAWPPDW